MTIGTAWADGAWIDAAWDPNAWSPVVLAGATYPRDSMPTDEQRFQDFIDSSGITKTGSLIDDYKSALANEVGLSVNDYDLPELFKRYFNSL